MLLIGVDAEILQCLVPVPVRGGIVFGVAHIHRSRCTESVDIVECLVTGLSFLSRNVEVLRFLEKGPGQKMVLDYVFRKTAEL